MVTDHVPKNNETTDIWTLGQCLLVSLDTVFTPAHETLLSKYSLKSHEKGVRLYDAMPAFSLVA